MAGDGGLLAGGCGQRKKDGKHKLGLGAEREWKFPPHAKTQILKVGYHRSVGVLGCLYTKGRSHVQVTLGEEEAEWICCKVALMNTRSMVMIGNRISISGKNHVSQPAERLESAWLQGW